jgi:uncharacterized protein (TIGR03435 family)
MREMKDIELLAQYARHDSEEAFATVVERHINLVYSTALRHAGNAHAAEEITQAVFIILARKAKSLGSKTILSGWLYQTARLTAANFLRTEMRRQKREQEAYMQSILNEAKPMHEEAWNQIAPLLDAAISKLGEKDRNAIVLRFFENKNLRDVGAELGVNEDAAKMRVNRALEKLRRFFTKRGVSSTTAIIAGMISANSVQAAPVALAKSVTAMAIAQGAAASGSTLTTVKGALKIMAWSKMKTVIVVGVGVLLAIGTSTVAIKEIQEHRAYPWQVNQGGIAGNQVNQPPQVRILRSKFQEPDWAILDGKMIGLGVRVQNVVVSAYGFMTPTRAIFSAKLPTDRYDYIACLPGGEDVNKKALQAEVKQKFGVVGKIEARDMDVWLLKVKYPNASGLKRNDKDYGNALRTTPSGFHGWNESMSNLASLLEDMANVPVIDETSFTNRFDFDLNCKQTDLENHDWNYINEALDQLGLELVPTNRSIEMLIVEKAQ